MKPLLVGITGGIGSGKSIVCRILETMKIPVYYADSESKKLLQNNPEVIREVEQLLGKDVYDNSGKPDRALIASMVFNNGELLQRLNAILHPAVRKSFMDWVKKNNEQPILVKEAAILFESGSHLELDFIVAVTAPEELRIKRVVDRDGKPATAIQKIIKEQMPQESLTERSNFVINNDGDHLLVPQVLNLLSHLQNIKSGKAAS